jgi:hypothetical protein
VRGSLEIRRSDLSAEQVLIDCKPFACSSLAPQTQCKTRSLNDQSIAVFCKLLEQIIRDIQHVEHSCLHQEALALIDLLVLERLHFVQTSSS